MDFDESIENWPIFQQSRCISIDPFIEIGTIAYILDFAYLMYG